MPEFRLTVKWTEEDLWDDAARTCEFRLVKGDFTAYGGVWRFLPSGRDVSQDTVAFGGPGHQGQRLATEQTSLELQEAALVSPKRMEELARIQQFIDLGIELLKGVVIDQSVVRHQFNFH